MTEANGTVVRCGNCGTVLNVSPSEPAGERTPCPACGSTSRAFEAKFVTKLALGLVVSASGVHYEWVKLKVSYIIGTFIIYTVFNILSLFVGIFMGGVLGASIGFAITTIISFIYAFFVNNKVKVAMARIGDRERK